MVKHDIVVSSFQQDHLQYLPGGIVLGVLNQPFIVGDKIGFEFLSYSVGLLQGFGFYDLKPLGAGYESIGLQQPADPIDMLLLLGNDPPVGSRYLMRPKIGFILGLGINLIDINFLKLVFP
jgi:hypothetical protein